MCRSHLHHDVTYLLEADPALPIRCKPDENSRVGWFGLDEAVSHALRNVGLNRTRTGIAVPLGRL